MTAANPAPPRPWIYDSPRDLALIILTPLLVLPLGVAARTAISAEAIYLGVMTLGNMGHHLPGMIRAYGDSDLFERFRTRFVLAPVILLAGCFYLSFRDLAALTFMVGAWGIWHGLAQVYGFSRIYDAKTGGATQTGALLDRGMCVGWFVGATLFSDERMLSLLEKFWETGGPLVTASLVRQVQEAWWAGMIGVTVAWLGYIGWRWRAGRPPSPVKIGFMLSSIGFWWYCMVEIEEVILGIALFEIVHDVQYLAIVWLYNRKRVLQSGHLHRAMGFLFRPSVPMISLYVGLVFAYGAMGFAGRELASAGVLPQVMNGLLAFSAFLHFYYDAFIWSVRDRETGRTLELDPSAALERWKAPAWLGHGLRWSYFVVPVLLLTAVSGVNAPKLWQYTEATVAFPKSPLAHYGLGEQLLASGDLAAAEATFRHVLELSPEFARAKAGLGHIALSQHAFGRAEQEFEAALSMDADCALAWAGLAALRFESRDLDAAREAVDHARSLDALEGNALLLDAKLRRLEGDRVGAEALYQQAAGWYPKRWDIFLELGVIYAETDRLEEAASAFERVLSQQPSNVRTRQALQEVRARISERS